MESKMTNKTPSGSQALDRAFSLLRIISSSQSDGLRLADLAERSGLNKPTTRRLLVALARAGFVEQATAGARYRLGPEIDVLSALKPLDLRAIAKPMLQRLVAETEDVVMLTIFSGNDSAIIDRMEGSFPLRTHIGRIGNRHPSGVGAASIAMLAALDDDELAERLANEPTRTSRYPQFTNAKVREMVKEAKRQGYALNPGLIFEGSWAMAVAVVAPGERPIAALTVAALESRLTKGRQKAILPIMQREASIFSNAVKSRIRES
jgi:DNA-binding IclR family transcriptional regulator